MGKIKVLSTDLSNKIAAGEVVERPASVVKELVENAIDANSRRIFVSVLEGGTRLIQVVDDGEGLSRDEAPLAFERHATSKITGEEDLNAIFTLGFRGEALPSIASISKVTLVSRRESDSEGTEMQMEGGVVQSIKTVGCPRGSTFEVRDLFYNVPARRKFLKSQQTEMGHISRVFFQLALAHENIHFRLTHGGRLILDAPACVSFQERAFQLLGEKVTAGAMALCDSAPIQKGMTLKALFSRPPLKRNFKKEQYLYVNLRPIKNALLTHAVYDAYQSYLMKGEEPFFLLFLTIDPAAVDVNVHPAKLEVRFQNTSQVHQAVRNAIRSALTEAGVTPFEKAKPPAKEGGMKVGDVSDSPVKPSSEGHAWLGWPDRALPRKWDDQLKDRRSTYQSRGDEADAVFASDEHPDLGLTVRASEDFPGRATPMIRPLAQVYGTFLLAEIDGELAMVDQHTAHERILYEAFLKAWEQHRLNEEAGLEIQPLLIPQQIDLSMAQSAVLKEHIALLEAIGCKIECFGETTFLVREWPALIAKMDVAAFLNEVTDDLLEVGATGKIDEPVRTIVASMACHGAVRANQSMSLPEMKALLETYFERNTPPTCPHGRPIVIRYPLLELEKQFRRK
ncbi:MAG: DNA mismatch repair endonuclease MutL [Nitrospiria bacterium]